MLTEKRLNELYSLHRKELFVYIFRFCRSEEIAEDILHDCFENLIRYSIRYPLEDVNIRSFLYRTAHNLAANHLKRDKRFGRVELDTGIDLPSAESVEQDAEYSELENAIQEYLSGCDEVSRSIFIMRKELSMDAVEIGKHLGIAERTVRRKLADLLYKMSGHLKKSGFLTFFPILLALLAHLIVT
ncbi:MAG: sigma-70 family RNA polymerase sigma factor [Spirochaetes bacterium]|nr:sigma-70 family RNA polymerase sigma factor [Spirochaetota bacterium]